MKTLDNSCKTSIEGFINDEMYAENFYVACASWCRNKGFDNAAKFFDEESKSEKKHAKRLISFLNGWNIAPALKSVKEPDQSFSSLKELLETAYDLEYTLLDKYKKASVKAMSEDLVVFDLYTEFRIIQNESVVEYSDLLNKLKLCTMGEFYFDQVAFGE